MSAVGSSVIRFIKRYTEKHSVQQVPTGVMHDNFMPKLLKELVRDGVIRSGVTGYWLPQAPDPGFVTVMNNQDKE